MSAKRTAPFQDTSTSWWPFGPLVIIQYALPLAKAGSRDLLEEVQGKSRNYLTLLFAQG